MAELVDASDSKSGIGNNVQVRLLFWARHKHPAEWRGFVFLLFAGSAGSLPADSQGFLFWAQTPLKHRLRGVLHYER